MPSSNEEKHKGSIVLELKLDWIDVFGFLRSLLPTSWQQVEALSQAEYVSF